MKKKWIEPELSVFDIFGGHRMLLSKTRVIEFHN